FMLWLLGSGICASETLCFSRRSRHTRWQRNWSSDVCSSDLYNAATHAPFPGNIVPQHLWDPVAKNILTQLIPEPNTPGVVSSTGDRKSVGEGKSVDVGGRRDVKKKTRTV